MGEPMQDAREARRPRAHLLLSEAARASVELGTMGAMLALLRRAPHGDGHHVLVFPGLMASDNSTRTLRWFLRDLGYRAHGWRLGVNIGPTERILAGMENRIALLHAEGAASISIIGWSLGGIYAREMARWHPHAVRQVITLGSPFALEDHEQSNARAVYNMLSTFHSPRVDALREPELSRQPVPVPTTAIYTKGDGIVPWRTCMDGPDRLAGDAENVRVIGSHVGLGHNPQVLSIIADRLAQPRGQWRPYSRRRQDRRKIATTA
jgi:pimeloyl-ACP methyl ester carboxylesterase